MVYGAAFCAVRNKEVLAKAAYADSKTLTEEKRESLFAQLKADANMGWMVDSISPQMLSAKMLSKCAHCDSPFACSCLFDNHAVPLRRNALTRPCLRLRDRYSLNAISFDSAFGLIQVRFPAVCESRVCSAYSLNLSAHTQAALDAGVNVAEIYVDTVGDADQYTRRLNERFTGIKCLAQPKADRDFPIVSAASIAAKVTRDTELRDWVFEPRLENRAGRKLGSGYPGDPETKAWLQANSDAVFGFPKLVRFSWATTKRLLDPGPDSIGAMAVHWEHDDEDEGQGQDGKSANNKRTGRLAFGSLPSHLHASSGAGRHSYFRARKMQRVTTKF
jgi:ribonuclease H2 subunit A